MENLSSKIQELKQKLAQSAGQPGLWLELSRLYWKQGAIESLRCIERAALIQPGAPFIEKLRREILYHGLLTLGSPSFRHGGAVQKVRIIPDGRIISASEDKTARIWDLSGKEMMRFQGHKKGITSLDIAWEKKWLVTGSADKTIRIWNLETGEEIRTIKGHEDIVTSVTFSPDSRLVLSGSEDGTCRVWESERGKEVLVFDKHTDAVNAVTISPDGKLAASGDWTGLCIVWILESGKAGTGFREHQGMIFTLRFSSDKRHILSSSEDGTVRLWDGATSKEERVFRGHKGPVEEANFSLDEKWIISGSQDKTILIWDTQTGKILKKMESPRPIHSVSLHPQKSYVVSSGRGPEVQVWSVDAAREITHPVGHRGKILSLDSKGILATVGSDDTCRLWDLKNGMESGVLEWSKSRVRCVSLSPSGQKAVIAGEDHVARVWDLPEQKVILHFEEHKEAITAVEYHPRLERIVSTDLAGEVHIWDGESGTPLAQTNPGLGSIYAAKFFPSGEFFVLGCEKNTTLVADSQNCVEFARFEGHSSPIREICITSDEKVVTFSLDYTLRVWDGGSGQEIHCFKLEKSRINGLVTLGNSMIVSGDEEGWLRFWNLKHNTEVHKIHLSEPILSLCYDSHHQEILAGLSNGCIRRVPQFEVM